MKAELEKKLAEKYPLLYADMRGDYRKTALAWGFEHGDGWFDIIDELSSKLEPMIQEYVKDHPLDQYFPRASQVKEKFATLRFYMTSELDGMFELIREAEDKSATVCELCGKPATVGRIRGWYSTRCEECKTNRRKDTQDD